MAVTLFDGKLNDELIIDAYSGYLQQHLKCCSPKHEIKKELNALLAYEEFKEYYILKLLGRASEFSTNLARDYQYMSIDNHLQPVV